MSEQAQFAILGEEEDPLLGLFFFESESTLVPGLNMNPGIDRPSATGMGALIGSEGLIVTCAHVVLALGACPGETVTLFGASAAVNIEVRAEVCAEGWQGPELDEQGQRDRALFWTDLWDSRPDVFRGDIAFLQILSASAVWHLRNREAVPVSPGAAQERLMQRARVLPFSRAGYKRAGAALVAWRVNWIFGGPDCQKGDARFLSYDREAHHAVRMSSMYVEHGFSGSPLWDPHRCTVVGLVRRALPAHKDLVLGTDARCFELHPLAKATPDRRMQALEMRLLSRLAAPVLDPWQDAAGGGSDARYIEPELAISAERNPLQAGTAVEYVPAIRYLSAQLARTPHMVVRGAAGSGKTALLRRLAMFLIERPLYAGGLRILPVLLNAAELLKSEIDLGHYLEQLWKSVRALDCTADAAVDVLAENGVTLVLLVDGLDEIVATRQTHILSRLHPASRSGRAGPAGRERDAIDAHILCSIVASRPTSQLASATVVGKRPYTIFDLCGFDENAINLFCADGFASAEAVAQFKLELRKLRWASGRVPPLQLQMAASLFQWDSAEPLPDRAVDLTASYVSHLIARGRQEFVERRVGKPRLANEVSTLYLPHIEEILAFCAACTIDGVSEGLSRTSFETMLESWTDASECVPWAGNVGSLASFLYQDFEAATAILSVRNDEDAPAQLVWAHRTFVETLNARHVYRACGGKFAPLSDRFKAMLKEAEHAQAIALLGVIDRAGAMEVSATLLTGCMQSPAAGTQPQLFSIRALAAGLDAGGRTRTAQVALLVRFFLTATNEPMICRQLFRNEDLPEAKEVLGYSELRNDIYAAMKARFRVRLTRASPYRPAIVLEREAQLLEHAKLWPEFLDMGLARPPARLRGDGHAVVAQGAGRPVGADGVARIEVVGKGDAATLLNMPASAFVAALATAARHTGPETPAARLVELAVMLYARESDAT